MGLNEALTVAALENPHRRRSDVRFSSGQGKPAASVDQANRAIPVEQLPRLAVEGLPMALGPHVRVVDALHRVAPHLDGGTSSPLLHRVRLGVQMLRLLGCQQRPAVSLAPSHQIAVAGAHHIPDGIGDQHGQPVVPGDPAGRHRGRGLVIRADTDATNTDPVRVGLASDPAEVRPRPLLESHPRRPRIGGHLRQRSIAVDVRPQRLQLRLAKVHPFRQDRQPIHGGDQCHAIPLSRSGAAWSPRSCRKLP